MTKDHVIGVFFSIADRYFSKEEKKIYFGAPIYAFINKHDFNTCMRVPLWAHDDTLEDAVSYTRDASDLIILINDKCVIFSKISKAVLIFFKNNVSNNNLIKLE